MRERLAGIRWLRRWVRALRRRTVAYPKWSRLLGEDLVPWRRMAADPAGSLRVLLGTSLGGYWSGTTLDSVLAIALRLRGAHVETLLCDAALPACQLCESRSFSSTTSFAAVGPARDLCGACAPPALRSYRDLGVIVRRYGELLTPAEREECAEIARAVPIERAPSLEDRGIAVGEHAHAGALRFFARGDLGGEPDAERVLRRYLEAALLAARVARGHFDRHAPDCVVLHHAIYVPQGVIAAVARSRGIRVVSWNPAYRRHSFIFSHDDSYHRTLLDEPTDRWEDVPWSQEREAELMEYLESRRRGTRDWIWFHERPLEAWPEIACSIGLRADRPVIGLLTNVIWDAQLHYRGCAFASMKEWLLATIESFAGRPGLQLAIRVHPAEIRGTVPSRQRVVDEIARAFPRLPENVFVVPPESPVSTYELLDHCESALIYGTKTGVELAARGCPVVVAGEAWVRGKGITHDAGSREEYFALLDRLPLPRSTPAQVERARRYAYHFFFRRMIPLAFLEATGGDPPFRPRIRGLDDLRPGASPGLDVICDGILHGREFIHPAEEIGWLEGGDRAGAM